ncbi:hypothetical protein [Sphingobacterium bovistauri]|uniref:Uncharacterized protein n=1 Tax=Sphingobacterium bovistauri TaxID=2781959 RepID=A0ABS7Z9M3_9SPHI|nr:hypothetical protein [Sphingobacterium bovistauri]MCA5005649.1 hypothetical protein [Sphingobacterium bovistauri]
MASQYFKTRKAFDFKAHAYALGNIMGVRPEYEDNHFLLKLYSLDESLYGDYYGYHLDYYLLKRADNKEKDFFTHIWYIVSDRIAYFQGRDPFSLKHAFYLSNIDKLKAFQSFLSPKDQWNIRPNDVLLKEKDELIAKLQKENKQLSNFRVNRKIEIYDDHFTTVIDLLQQLQTLKLPNGAPLLRRDQQSPYYKILSNYFSNNKKEISLDTARNYFVDKAPEDAQKGVEIPENRKLFRIIPLEYKD